MSVPVPLGVRIFRPGVFDRWVTNLVDDISFRSVVPGGFASATIKLHRPSPITIYSSATATGQGTSATPNYLVASDADAADINIGDRVHIYDSSGAIRFSGQPFTVTAKPSFAGFTNITFSPAASASTVSGDVMRCSNATGYLAADAGRWDETAELFNRVQIVDLRTSEVAWEGRIEDTSRSTEDDTFELGCLGSMVCATDIKRPVFYIDDTLDSWISDENYNGDIFTSELSETARTINTRFSNNIYTANTVIFTVYRYQRMEECGMYLARYDITYEGHGPAGLAAVTNVTDAGGFFEDTNIDVTQLTTAATRKANPVGAANSFTSTTAQRIYLYLGNNSGSNITVSDANPAREVWRDLHVQAMRVDHNGTILDTAASYPNDYVTVSQVVEDVVGRFLVSRWSLLSNNHPFAGQVRTSDMYIDTSSTAQITRLTFFDGATAADVLNELMLAQPTAYWAIWESKFGATDGSEGNTASGYRFAWETWPNGWGYQATSVDGLQDQPNGENLQNFLYYQWETSSVLEPGFKFQQLVASTSQNRALTNAKLVRGTTIKREERTDSSTATTAATAELAKFAKTPNSGSITIRRPVAFYDAGANSLSGASRMLDPWMLRPGKLIRITDLPPPARSGAFEHGTSAPPIELDGTVFKVVATEYSSADNACRMELDQVSNWATPTQIAQAAEGPATTLRVVG